MAYKFNIKKLCTPASIYFLMSMIAFLIILVQNLGGEMNVLCVGDYKCDIGNVFVGLIMNLIYIIFWTFVLDLMCKNGYEKLSWIIVLLPILLFFVMLTSMMLFYPVA
tara:strand:- start:488 stop:811 length:324 start_codon:yes stop_codon:yes gene_type:complete